MQTVYSAPAAADIALSAATAKSIIGVNGASDFGIDLKGIHLGFDGATSTNTPALIEVCAATFATNPPGTASTSITPVAIVGRANAATGFAAASNWTTEPTVLTVVDSYRFTVYGGTEIYDLPLSYDGPLANGFVVRVTAAQAVNVRATLLFSRT